jgi:hypothetical protein
VRRCKDAVDAEKKVLIGFRLGDLSPRTFTYTKGNRIGETGVSLKARLLYVYWIKVNGELVYKAEPKAVPADDGNAPTQVTSPDAVATAATSDTAASEPANDNDVADDGEATDIERRAVAGQSF